jgi:hypothetical protein
MPPGVPVIVLPVHINDEAFADSIIEQIAAFEKDMPATESAPA